MVDSKLVEDQPGVGKEATGKEATGKEATCRRRQGCPKKLSFMPNEGENGGCTPPTKKEIC